MPAGRRAAWRHYRSILALARVTGETAPLLFTAFGSQFWEFNPSNPMAELSLQNFTVRNLAL